MTKTLFRWEQDRDGGEHGTLVLWPDTRREMSLIVADFKTANDLGVAIYDATQEAFKAGRRSMQDEIKRIAP